MSSVFFLSSSNCTGNSVHCLVPDKVPIPHPGGCFWRQPCVLVTSVAPFRWLKGTGAILGAGDQDSALPSENEEPDRTHPGFPRDVLTERGSLN